LSILLAIVLIGILIFIHELGHFLFAKFLGVKVLKFSLGFGPRIIGKKWGETEYLISAFPIGGYIKMLGEDPSEIVVGEDKKRAFSEQSVFKRFLIVFAGPFFNILFTYVIFTMVLAAGFPINIPMVKNLLPVIESVEQGYPAKEAGIKPGDIVIKIDEQKIDTWFDMVNIISKNPNKELTFTIKRRENIIKLKIIPRLEEIKTITGKTIKIGRIGVRKLSKSVESIKAEQSIFSIPFKSAEATYKMGSVIVASVCMLIKGEVSFKNIGGPITIFKASKKAASIGFLSYIVFMAFFSVNLGILNLLPIPMLDGGHLVIFGIEAVKGSPLKEKTIIIIYRIGLLILILIMIFALYFDILRITGKKM